MSPIYITNKEMSLGRQLVSKQIVLSFYNLHTSFVNLLDVVNMFFSF